MHLAVLLFLTGVAFAYPLKPAQESRLVPREQPQGRCFRPINGVRPVLIHTTTMYKSTCKKKSGAVGWIKKTPTGKTLWDFRAAYENSESDPEECLLPTTICTGELGYCFILKNATPPANPPRPIAPQNSQHPPAQAPHPPAQAQHLPAQAPPRPDSPYSFDKPLWTDWPRWHGGPHSQHSPAQAPHLPAQAPHPPAQAPHLSAQAPPRPDSPYSFDKPLWTDWSRWNGGPHSQQ